MKKLLTLILTLLSTVCLTLGLTACGGNDGGDSNSNKPSPEMQNIYNNYVVYAESIGQTPLPYEQWLESIKGEKGDKGDKGDPGTNGFNGADGQDGKDGVTPTIEISDDGYWVINGVKTEHKAIGADGAQGEKGDKGDQGEQGIQGEKGDKGDQGIQGEKGDKGDQGIQGEKGDKGDQGIQGETGATIEKIEFDEDGKLVITLTDGTVLDPVELPEKEEHVHSFGEWLNYTQGEGSCEDFFYRQCEDCSEVVFKKGTYEDHSFETVTVEPTCQAGGYDIKTCSICGFEERVNETPISDHNYEEDYRYDNSFHYIKCKDCTAEKDRAEHTADNSGYCTVCDAPVGTTEGIVYDLSSDGTYYEVIDYEGTATKIIIADTYKNKPVKTIYQEAFYNKDITSVVIPSTITSIGDYAFNNCSSLTRVDYLGTIDEWAQIEFGNISSNPLLYAQKLYINGELVTEANITTATEISEWAFFNCYSLTSVTIPSSVTSIGDCAFRSCYSLTSVTIPSSVTSIGKYAFYYCKSLTSIEIPSSVTSIGDYALYNCESLTSVVIGNSVTSIGNSAFGSCDSLTSIEIPNSVTSLGEEAFSGCTSLTSVTFGENSQLTSIGSSAFSSCTSLTSVTIGNSLTYIGSSAFSGCTSLTSVTIGNSVRSIGERAFENCSSLTSIEIPNSVTSIGEKAFDGCTKLFVEKDNVRYVKAKGNDYFLAYEITYKNLSTYTIQNTTKILGCGSSPFEGLFYGCSRLTSITIPNSVTSIGRGAFGYCSSLTSVTIGSGVTSIGDDAFCECTSLTRVDYLGSIDEWAQIEFVGQITNPLRYAENLYINGELVTEANITTATKISNHAFWACTSLTSIEIPNSVTSIGDWAFYYCTSLTSITFNGTMAEWNTISKGHNWNEYVPATKVICTDGNVTI